MKEVDPMFKIDASILLSKDENDDNVADNQPQGTF